MNIDEVNEGVQRYRATKRLGRGAGSGQGKTSGRGHKGQFTVSGSSHHAAFQGGQMPLIRKIPKRGFNNKFALTVAAINVADLEANFASGESVSPETLRAKSLVKFPYEVLKILGSGDLTKSLKVAAHRFSASAKEKIEKAGGSVEVLPGPQPVPRNKSKKAAGK
jgi:large subunit ribosomal protein L15